MSKRKQLSRHVGLALLVGVLVGWALAASGCAPPQPRVGAASAASR